MAYKIKSFNLAWNPLKKGFRNEMCPCGSGQRFKTCCQLKMPWLISRTAYIEMQKCDELRWKFIAMYGFMTSPRMKFKAFVMQIKRFFYRGLKLISWQ